MGVSHFGNGGDLLRPVGGAELGELGEADGDRLAAVRHVDLHVLEAGRQRVGRELAAGTGERRQRDAAAEEGGGARLVDRDVRVGVAEDDAARPRVGGERQRVGHRSAGDEENRHLAFEDFGKTALDGLRDVVGAVGGMAAAGGLGERVDDMRRSARPVVAGEDHALL